MKELLFSTPNGKTNRLPISPLCILVMTLSFTSLFVHSAKCNITTEPNWTFETCADRPNGPSFKATENTLCKSEEVQYEERILTSKNQCFNELPLQSHQDNYNGITNKADFIQDRCESTSDFVMGPSKKDFLYWESKANKLNAASSMMTIKVCYKNVGAYAMGGTNRRRAADKLLNPANFGPGGTSEFTMDLHRFTGDITLAELMAQGCQIVEMGIAGSDAGSGTSHNSYKDSEENAIIAWSALSHSNVVLAYQGFATRMSGTDYQATGTGNNNPNSLTTIGESLLNGPFGVVAAFNQGGGYQGIFRFTPPSACVVVEDATNDPTGVLDNATGDVYLADVGLVDQLGGLTQNANITSNTDRFFANLFHSLARIVLAGNPKPCEIFMAPPDADLSVSVAPATQTGNKAEYLTYVVTLTNNGPEIATNVEVAVPMPANTATLVSSSMLLGTYSGLTEKWIIPNMPLGSTTLEFTVQVD